jgi:anthranilate phosphoribosyltransferase
MSGDDVQRRELHPADFGVPTARLDDLLGAGQEENCRIARAVLGGERGPRRDIVAVNAGAALWLAGRAATLADCARLAEQAIDSGAAQAKLDRLIQWTQSQ